MKTSEAIAMLEKNPQLRFRLKDSKETEMHVETERCNAIKSKTNGYMGFHITDEWEPIQQPVPFLEAVKAYTEGKTIRCEMDGKGEMTNYFNPNVCKSGLGYGVWIRSNATTTISTEQILNGVWYIEESEE